MTGVSFLLVSEPTSGTRRREALPALMELPADVSPARPFLSLCGIAAAVEQGPPLTRGVRINDFAPLFFRHCLPFP